MKSGKREIMKRIEQNQKRISNLEKKENYKYLGILEGDTIKQAQRKKK